MLFLKSICFKYYTMEDIQLKKKYLFSCKILVKNKIINNLVKQFHSSVSLKFSLVKRFLFGKLSVDEVHFENCN